MADLRTFVLLVEGTVTAATAERVGLGVSLTVGKVSVVLRVRTVEMELRTRRRRYLYISNNCDSNERVRYGAICFECFENEPFV